MEAGQSTRQHSELALLYPRSKTLQSYITEYFIVVVQICLRFHRFTQKSALGKFTSSLDDTDIKDARSSLLAWSKSIQAEIGILLVQRIELEAESNSHFKNLMRANHKSASEQQKQIALRNLLDTCSTHDYETTWRQIRKAGNTCLYKQLPEYNQWLVAPDPETLVLVGTLGYGKSVALANIVDDLNLKIKPGSSGLAYFFCQHDVPESLIAKTVTGTLMRQFIRPLIHRIDSPVVLEKDELSRLLDLMRAIKPPDYIGYAVLDGLDLCSAQEREKIIEGLELMRSHFPLYVCVSRRLEPETMLLSIATEFSNANVVKLPDNSSDIEAFIAAQLETALSNKSLSLGDPAIILEIQDTLLQGSQGMFLWVALQIQSLCTMQTDHDIREALADLPEDLSQIYIRILQQPKTSGQSFQSNILKLVSSARRPLTTDEMQEALSVIPGNKTWDSSRLLNNIYPALATCGPLIAIDEEEHTIRTVHPSVNQFLLQKGSKQGTLSQGAAWTEQDAQALMASTIVTYLSYGVFGTEIAVRIPTLNVGPTPSRVLTSTISVGKNVQDIALKLLRSRKQPDFDASKVLAGSFKRGLTSGTDAFHFQHYAKTYALRHLATLPIISYPTSEAFFRLFKQGAIRAETHEEVMGLLWLAVQHPGTTDISELLHRAQAYSIPYNTAEWHRFPGQLLYWAIENGRGDAIKYLLNIYDLIFLNPSDAKTSDATKRIIRPVLEHIDAVDDYFAKLYMYDKEEFRHSIHGLAPLCHAIEHDQDLAIEILINNQWVEINDEMSEGLSPAMIAVKRGNINALRTLLLSERFVITETVASALPYEAPSHDSQREVRLLLEDYFRKKAFSSSMDLQLPGTATTMELLQPIDEY
jgi:hypothetical protein